MAKNLSENVGRPLGENLASQRIGNWPHSHNGKNTQKHTHTHKVLLFCDFKSIFELF